MERNLQDFLLHTVNIPKQYISIDFTKFINHYTDNIFVKRLTNLYTNIIDIFNKVGLYIQGGLGSGKTTFSILLLTEYIIKHYKSGYFITYKSLLNKIISDNNDVEKSFYHKITSVDLLVIDDFASYMPKNDWPISVIEEIIRHRVQNNLPIIYTSNKEINTIKQVYNDAVFSLLQESIYLLSFPNEDIRYKLYKQNQNYINNYITSKDGVDNVNDKQV